ncbi:hypothetical protein LNP26_27615 [Klebsiella variicola subsp. variicola]|nr:hypothetical protein [Klebsiella variicola subsp. variicola]
MLTRTLVEAIGGWPDCPAMQGMAGALQTLNSDIALRNSYSFRLMIEPMALLTPQPAC